MYKYTAKYKDFDGNDREEDYYFYLNEVELTEFQFAYDGGLDKFMKKIYKEKDIRRIIEIFKLFIRKSYGEKSLDGKKFEKVDADGRNLFQKNFEPTEAYTQLFMKLATDSDEASRFINGIANKTLVSSGTTQEIEDNSVVDAPAVTTIG